MFISVSPSFHLLLPRGTLTTFFGYDVNTLNTVGWLCLWTGWTRSVYVCVGPFKRDSTREMGKKNR